jgi:hypothetical protein
MKIKLLINNNEEKLFNLITEKTAITVIRFITDNILLKNKIEVFLYHDLSVLDDYWYKFLLSCGVNLETRENYSCYYTSNKEGPAVKFLFTVISLLHLRYSRKFIIGNVIFLKEHLKTIPNSIIYMIALHCSHKPKYSKIITLSKPYDFSEKIQIEEKIIDVFNNKEPYESNKLLNAMNLKNIKLIKKYI